ncbi:Fc.00g074040.m01.CDS01 [Cosmosporella sp. VM-42]
MKYQHFATLALAGLAAAQSSQNITEVLAANNDTLSTLNGLLAAQPGLVRALSSMNNITILAPSNDAFEAFLNDTDVARMVGADPGAVTAVLSYHVLNGTYMANDFMNTSMFIETMLSNRTYENVTGGQVVEARMNNDTVSFYSALKAESNVTTADLNFTGGVIHIVNNVLQIPMNLTDTAIAADLTAVTGAVQAANLTKVVTDMTNITVFAPSNGAFASIASIFANLSSDDLENILKYHVVSGSVGYSNMLMNGSLDTAEGGKVNIQVDNGAVYVNEAKVIIPDVLIANGVVHVIDGVLNPNATNTRADPSATTTTPAFSGATSAGDGGVPFTSNVAPPSETASGLTTSTSVEAGVHATAAVALGALLGGAVMVVNGL